MTEKKGSLTIFAAISFMLVAELLFTLAEGTRYVQLQKIAGQNTVAAGNALLAEYCSPLWEKYQILGCMPSPSVGEAFSTEELEKEVLAITDMNFEVEKRAGLFAQYNLLRLGVSEAKIQDYELLTDVPS